MCIAGFAYFATPYSVMWIADAAGFGFSLAFAIYHWWATWLYFNPLPNLTDDDTHEESL